MNNARLQRAPTAFLQAVTVLVGLGVLAFLLWEPNIEGVNANATFFEVYFDDPLLAYAYVASIPFFVGLYHIFKLLEYAGRGEFVEKHSVKSLRTIRYCAMAMIVFIPIGVLWILSGESDDRPPIVAMGVLTTFASIVTATTALVFEKIVLKEVLQ
jgi:Protein of unknown function (DUF2975)